MLGQRVEHLRKAIKKLVLPELDVIAIDFDCLFNHLKIQIHKWDKELLGDDYQIRKREADPRYPYQQEKTINGATFFKLLTWDEFKELEGEDEDGELCEICF